MKVRVVGEEGVASEAEKEGGGEGEIAEVGVREGVCAGSGIGQWKGPLGVWEG